MTQRTRLFLLAAATAAVLVLTDSCLRPDQADRERRPERLVHDLAHHEAGARGQGYRRRAPTRSKSATTRTSTTSTSLGPGVNQTTDVDFVGTRTWTVTFQDGQRYRYVCDPHAGQMNGSFTTGGGPPPSPPPPPPPPRIQVLTATVGPAPTISLRRANGRRVTSLRRGRYRIVVRDRSTIAQLPPDRPRREPQDDRALPRHRDVDVDAAAWDLPLHLRPAREADEGELPGDLVGSLGRRSRTGRRESPLPSSSSSAAEQQPHRRADAAGEEEAGCRARPRRPIGRLPRTLARTSVASFTPARSVSTAWASRSRSASSSSRTCSGVRLLRAAIALQRLSR